MAVKTAPATTCGRGRKIINHNQSSKSSAEQFENPLSNTGNTETDIVVNHVISMTESHFQQCINLDLAALHKCRKNWYLCYFKQFQN